MVINSNDSQTWALSVDLKLYTSQLLSVSVQTAEYNTNIDIASSLLEYTFLTHKHLYFCQFVIVLVVKCCWAAVFDDLTARFWLTFLVSYSVWPLSYYHLKNAVKD